MLVDKDCKSLIVSLFNLIVSYTETWDFIEPVDAILRYHRQHQMRKYDLKL